MEPFPRVPPLGPIFHPILPTEIYVGEFGPPKAQRSFWPKEMGYSNYFLTWDVGQNPELGSLAIPQFGTQIFRNFPGRTP